VTDLLEWSCSEVGYESSALERPGRDRLHQDDRLCQPCTSYLWSGQSLIMKLWNYYYY